MSFLLTKSTTAQDKAGASYPILVASPGHEEVFDFSNKDASVSIEIKSKEIKSIT